MADMTDMFMTGAEIRRNSTTMNSYQLLDETLYLLCDLANCLSLVLSLTLAVIKQTKAAMLAASSNVVKPKRDPKTTTIFPLRQSPLSAEEDSDSRSASNSNRYHCIQYQEN